jgi:hypothetical protein
MQNVGAWKILGKCSTRCHIKMSSLGLPYLEDVILSYKCVHHVHFVCSMLVVNCNSVRVQQHCQMWYYKSQVGLGLKLCMFIT